MDKISLRQMGTVHPYIVDVLETKTDLELGFPVLPTVEEWRKSSEFEAKFDRPRDEIVDRILAGYGDLPLSDSTKENIEALRKPGTLTVITGQQVGLGGGPMLTLNKAITSIVFARIMEERSGIRTVPVFWMATSDHNLREAAQLHWIDLDNQLQGIKIKSSENRIPVGQLPLGDLANELIDRLSKDLPTTDFSAEIASELRRHYYPENTFADAFRGLGNWLLGKYGLVFFDPEEPQIKKMCKPFWVDAVKDTEERLERLTNRSRAIMEAGYKLQANVEKGRPAIFYLEDGVRRKVVLEGRAIRARSDIILSKEELLNIAEKTPELLSAGVTLRPLLQSYVLPTGAYIAGPHEMAYWAQLPDAFEPMGLNKPAVVPRASFTIIEQKVRRKLNKYHLSPASFLGDLDQLQRELLRSSQTEESEYVFKQVEHAMSEGKELLIRLADLPEFSGLDNSVDTAFRKIKYHIDKLHHHYTDRIHRQHSDLLTHVEKLRTHLCPEGIPQERVISPLYYMTRYGHTFIDEIIENTSDAIGMHGFIEL